MAELHEFHIVCAWCSAVIQQGIPNAPESHGICKICYAKEMRALDTLLAKAVTK